MDAWNSITGARRGILCDASRRTKIAIFHDPLTLSPAATELVATAPLEALAHPTAVNKAAIKAADYWKLLLKLPVFKVDVKLGCYFPLAIDSLVVVKNWPDEHTDVFIEIVRNTGTAAAVGIITGGQVGADGDPGIVNAAR